MKKEIVSNSYGTDKSDYTKSIALSWLNKNMIIDLICSLLILLFIYAAISKLSDYERFRVQISKSPFITSFANWVSWCIPTVEMLIALLLVIKRTRQIGLYASFFLMNLFTFYLVAMLNFSYYIPCSCGGILEYLSWNQHILFNVFFVAIAGAGIFLNKNIYA